MSWALKVKVLEGQGKTREEALTEIVQQLFEANRQMDIKLSKCIDCLTPEQIKDIFGDVIGEE